MPMVPLSLATDAWLLKPGGRAGSKSTRRSTAADASTVSVLDAAVGSDTI
jgi:hypothetical protein